MKQKLNELARRVGLDTSEVGVATANWGVAVGQPATHLEPLTAGAPPLKFYDSGSVDLEFGPLLMVDYLVMDQGAYQRILNENKSPHLSRLRSTLRALHDEGFVRLEDYRRILSDHEAAIVGAARDQSTNIKHWLPALRLAVAGWESGREPLERLVGPRGVDEKLHIPYGILCHLLNANCVATESEYQAVRSLIFSEKRRFSRAESEILADCLLPYLQHVISFNAVRNELEMPLVDWNNLRPLYAPLHSQVGVEAPRADREMAKCREFFDCFVPDFEPTSYRQILTLLKDNRVRELRAFIRTATRERHEFSSKDYQALLFEIAGIDVKRGRAGTGINITGLAAGLGVAAATGDPATGAAAAVAVSGMQELAGRTTTDYFKKDIRWLYMLIESRRGET